MRNLQQTIGAILYERTALSKQPDALIWTECAAKVVGIGSAGIHIAECLTISARPEVM